MSCVPSFLYQSDLFCLRSVLLEPKLNVFSGKVPKGMLSSAGRLLFGASSAGQGSSVTAWTMEDVTDSKYPWLCLTSGLLGTVRHMLLLTSLLGARNLGAA